MTAQTDEHQRTLAFAEIALGQIKALRQPAYPRNYEVWYAYATGYNPSLNQTINETLNRNGTLTTADVDQIYEICVRRPSQFVLLLRNPSKSLSVRDISSFLVHSCP